jgi:hypothetical protein
MAGSVTTTFSYRVWVSETQMPALKGALDVYEAICRHRMAIAVDPLEIFRWRSEAETMRP